MNNNNNKHLINNCFKAIETKDIERLMDNFHTKSEIIDPHYPVPHMKGKDEISEGLLWGFQSLKTFGFTITRYYETEDRENIAVEVLTEHELYTGKKLNFQQMFCFEIKDNKITKMQAYEPYGPHGMLNIILKIMRLIRKIRSVFRIP